MFFSRSLLPTTTAAVLASAMLAGVLERAALAQSAPQPAQVEATSIALPLPEDRGYAALEQGLKRLGTTASLMIIVAHPDDEDGALLTYLSRGLGVRTTLFTLTRGEGGQNAMSADTYDALGLIRTNELLKADEYYGTKQLWGTQADFGFSKTQEEAFQKWGHDRVLYDAVMAVRQEHPQIIASTFVGGITDGHGQHQVSGEIAQEVFKAAGDASVFPDQLKPVSEGGLGLTVWQPSAVYSMVPFAPVTEKGMFDYATGKWAPAKFHNYVTGEWINGVVPSSDVTIPVGTLDHDLGRSYEQIAREGWGMQKSQYGGANPSLSGPDSTSYHLWAVHATAKASGAKAEDHDLFHNSKVNVNTTIAGLAQLGGDAQPAWLAADLQSIDDGVKALEAGCPCTASEGLAHKVAAVYKQTLSLRAKVAGSGLATQAKGDLVLELDAKITQFQAVLQNLLGLEMAAFRTNQKTAESRGFRGNSADETARSAVQGQDLRVRVHTTRASSEAKLERVWLESQDGEAWKSEIVSGAPKEGAGEADPIFAVHVPDNAEPTKPSFTRPSIEQPYYDVAQPVWRVRSFAPWPLAAWAEYSFDGVPVRVGEVVQTLARVTGPGGIYQPLVVTPAVGVSIAQDARILPLNGGSLPVDVTIHTEEAKDGTVELKLPDGWKASPSSAPFHRSGAGDSEPIRFTVTPVSAESGAYSIRAVAHADGHAYTSGWESIGYAGLRPYNQYKTAELKTRKVDVKLAPGLKVAYVMGSGDLMPDAMQGMGLDTHLLTSDELSSADLSAWNVLVIGIRAYSVRPELIGVQSRLDEFVRKGGTLIVQYQSANFPAPLPLSLGRSPERVVDETAHVGLLDGKDPVLSWPNTITSADFDGWVEERGHSFLESWDKGYTALTETADPGQDPQRGGLVVAHVGKGVYIYEAYALYRQLPELVPGAYRIWANLLSAGRRE